MRPSTGNLTLGRICAILLVLRRSVVVFVSRILGAAQATLIRSKMARHSVAPCGWCDGCKVS